MTMMITMLSQIFAALLVSVASASSQDNWISISRDVQFQPATRGRHLTSSVDPNGIFYAGDAQAWRYLGFFSDCEGLIDEDQDGQIHECQRYLLWAAYVDINYKGTGIGEYQMFDPETNQWSKCASTKRCVQMDCHLGSSSNFELLGLYKVSNYNDWLYSLGMNIASCDNVDRTSLIYDEMLPEGCVQINNGNNNNGQGGLYYALKPTAGGSIDLGLYTDSSCSTEYTRGDKNVYSLISNRQNRRSLEENGNNGNGQMSLSTYMTSLNQALDQYKVCTPCRAYNIPHLKGMQASFNQNRQYGEDGQAQDQQQQQAQQNGQQQNGQQQQGGGYQTYAQRDIGQMTSYEFMCNTASGMRSPNQCSLFSQNMQSASFQDVALAAQQGTIPVVSLKGMKIGGSTNYGRRDSLATAFFAISVAAFLISVIALIWRCRKTAAEDSDLETPLVANDEGVHA